MPRVPFTIGLSAIWPVITLLLTLAPFGLAPAAGAASPEYSIAEIRFADSIGDPVAEMVIGAPADEKINDLYAVWLIRGGGRVILFDSGFHRARWFKEYHIENYVRPDEALRAAGVKPEQVTDVVISHAHWDHLGGIDLFPKSRVWIQKEEFRYYTGEAWQPGGDHDGIDPDDVVELERVNTQGRLHLIDGDNVEIFPGIRAYTGGRHTFASQYLAITGTPNFVLASDNVYLYRNLLEHKPSATFTDSDHDANVRSQARMISLAGSMDRVIPGHDSLPFEKFPSHGRVATLK